MIPGRTANTFIVRTSCPLKPLLSCSCDLWRDRNGIVSRLGSAFGGASGGLFVWANGFTSFNTTSADSTQLCFSAAAAGEDFWCMLPSSSPSLLSSPSLSLISWCVCSPSQFSWPRMCHVITLSANCLITNRQISHHENRLLTSSTTSEPYLLFHYFVLFHCSDLIVEYLCKTLPRLLSKLIPLCCLTLCKTHFIGTHSDWLAQPASCY